MDTDALADMVALDRAEWQQLAALLDAQPAAPVHGPGSPDWNARDVYTHFARWLDHSTDDFEATLAGRAGPSWTVPMTRSTRAGSRKTPPSPSTTRPLAQRAFDRRIEMVQSTPADR